MQTIKLSPRDPTVVKIGRFLVECGDEGKYLIVSHTLGDLEAKAFTANGSWNIYGNRIHLNEKV